MMLEDVMIIIKNIYNKYIYYILFVMYVISNIMAVELYSLSSIKSWLIFLSITFVFIILLIIIFEHRKIPRFKKDENGILFSIEVDDEKQYSLINAKFVKEFQRMLISNNLDYKVLLLNRFVTEKLNEKYINSKDFDTVFKKTNSKCLFFGRCLTGGEKENVSCFLNINSAVPHKPISHEGHLFLRSEMMGALLPISNIKIMQETETDDFETYVLQLNIAFKYILATTDLVTENTQSASEMFENIKKSVINIKKNIPVINFVKNVIDDRLCFCYNNMASEQLNKYYENNDRNDLVRCKQYLDKAYCCEKNSYRYKLIIAIFYFENNRDIETSLKYIDECGGVTLDDSWKFSKVFLKLYKNDDIKNFLYAYKIYSNSFDKNRNFQFMVNLLDFIHRIYNVEPEKKQLIFLIILLNHYIGDKESVAKYCKIFEESYISLLGNDNFKNIYLKIKSILESEDSEGNTI